MRVRLAIAAAALLALGSDVLAQTGEMPRRPIPYTQLQRPARPTPAARPRVRTTPPATRPRAEAPARPARAPLPSTPAQTAAAASAPPAGAPVLPPPMQPPAARNGARLGPGEPISPGELEAYVDGVVRSSMSSAHVAGLSVAVVQNGQIVLLKGFGDAVLPGPGQTRRPVDPQRTLFHLGGASRLFTALLTLKAVEQGGLRLDQPVNYVLPPVLRIADDDVRRPILVRHLLTQTAGFEQRDLGRTYVVDPARLKPLEAALTRDPPRRVYAPGEVSSESAYGSALLGAAAAASARRPFVDLVESDLTGPLRLARTTFREPYPARAGLPAPMAPELARDLTRGYRWTGRGFVPVPPTFGESFAPAVSASTTAYDMARLMTALLDGGRLEGAQAYGPGVARLLGTPFQKTPAGLNAWPGGLIGGELSGRRTLGFAGERLASHAALTVVPDLRLGIFVAANTDTAGPTVQRLAGRIVERFYTTPAPLLRAGDPAFAQHAGSYSGRYVSSARALHGLERVVDRFGRAMEVRVTPEGYLLTRRQGRSQLWAPEGGGALPSRFRAADGDALLTAAIANGRAVAFTPADNLASYTRVGWFLHPRLLAVGAAAVAIAAALSLFGALIRTRREVRRTDAQLIGGALQAGVSLLWLAAFACAFAWRESVPDRAALIARWPGAWLIMASSLALIAFVGSLLSAAQLIELWRTDRRGGGWTRGRRARHTVTTLLFVAYGALLALWGALTPWSP